MAARTSKLWKVDKEYNDGDKITSSNLASFIVKMKEKDINYDFIMNTFGEFKGKCLAHTYDLIEIPPRSFSYINDKDKEVSNSNTFTTTIGIYIFNLILSEMGFSKFFDGYYQDSLDMGNASDLEQVLTYALIDSDISVEQMKKWEDYMEWFMPFEGILSPGQTERMMSCTKAINKKKEELLKKYAKEIESGDIVIAEQIEKELLAYAKEYLKDDPSMDTILSGAGGSFGNNFKNMYVMKGAIKNPDPNAKRKYDIVTSSYLDGIKADEYSIIAGSGAQGAYSRGKKTETGGYWEKLFISSFQHIKLDPKGSDCGTKHYIEVLFDKSNIKDYMYSYMIIGSSLILLTPKNYKNYIGKKVKLRFSSMCKSETGICNMCAGELLYVSVENIGMAISQIPSTLKTKAMKSFHDVQIRTSLMDPMEAFYPFGTK